VFFILNSNKYAAHLTVLLSHSFAHGRGHKQSIYHISGRPFLYPVDTSLCPTLSAIVSQLFPARDRLYICGRQELASAP
jgi:hypothetical protein